MPDINKLIEQGLEVEAHVICLFDEDVKQWNPVEAQRINGERPMMRLKLYRNIFLDLLRINISCAFKIG